LAGPGARVNGDAQPRLRIDKWLWQARFFKSRKLSAELVEAGSCRVNGNRIGKPGHGVAPGDVLTFPQGGRIRVVRVTALGQRRGPATEAQTLYADLAPVPEAEDETPRALE
jgi:ribosome-associated heat shock protein Hsp15